MWSGLSRPYWRSICAIVSGVARSPSSDWAGPAGRARIQRNTRIESPSRIGTSSSSRRTTKRSIAYVARRLRFRYGWLFASLSADRDGREELVRRRARDEPFDVPPERERRLGVRIGDRRKLLHDVLVRFLVHLDPRLAIGFSLRVVEQLEQRRIAESELRAEALEERPDEVVGVREVPCPPDQVQVAGVALVDPAEVVRIPRRGLRDDPEPGPVQTRGERLEVVLRVRHVRPRDVARVPEL